MASISTVSSMALTGLREVGGSLARELALQHARRTAMQAEQEARRLRREADALKEQAQRTQEEARRLYRQSDQQENAASLARRSLALASSANEMRKDLASRVSQVVDQRAFSAVAGAESRPRGAVNSEGQVTGRVIDIAV